MSSFFFFMGLFLFYVAFTSAIDVREMSIDEYINFVNPPAVLKFQDKYGDNILCVKFSDQISVKYAHDNITRGLKKAPKLKSSTLNISNFDSGGAKTLKLVARSECPADTVEVREIKREEVERAGSVRQFLERGGRGKLNAIPNVDNVDGVAGEHSLVLFEPPRDLIFGATALLNIWRPVVAADAYFSNSQIWLMTKYRGKLESIEVGWAVNPTKYGDNEPRLFVLWTSDNYLNGCYDLECPGYVPIPGARSPRSGFARASRLGGVQAEFQLTLEQQVRQRVGEVWALLYEEEIIGYWPMSLFEGLGQGAAYFDLGGEVCYDQRPQGSAMTRTEMGSGKFASRGYHYAAYIRSIRMYDSAGHEIHSEPTTLQSKPECYQVEYHDENRAFMGKHVFFGGPGPTDQNHACVA